MRTTVHITKGVWFPVILACTQRQRDQTDRGERNKFHTFCLFHDHLKKEVDEAKILALQYYGCQFLYVMQFNTHILSPYFHINIRMENLFLSLTANLTEHLLPWLTILLSITISLLVKDMISAISKGIMFRMSSHFNEGDIVYLDGEKAIIVNMGLFQTVFSIDGPQGKVWRIVPNDRISFLRLDRIIDTKPGSDEIVITPLFDKNTDQK